MNFDKSLNKTSLDQTAIELYNNFYTNNTDCGGDKDSRMHNYLNYYDEILKKFENNKFKYLEIGVFSGHSLVTIDKYYPQVNITGIDINLKPYYKFMNDNFKNKIKEFNVYECNSVIKKDVNNFLKNEKFDVILDDGCHKSNTIIRTFENLFFDYLNPGGIYIIEDIHNDGVAEYFNKFVKNTVAGYENIFISLYKNIFASFNHGKLHYKFRNKINDKYYKNIFSIEFLRRRIIIKKVDNKYYH